MKIALLNIQTRDLAINKTMAGGYGTSSNYGDGRNLLTRILKSVKKKGVKIPLTEFAYLGRLFKQRGHKVEISCSKYIPDAELYLIYVSLVEFNMEIKTIREIRKNNLSAKIGLIGTFVSVFPELLKNHADFIITGESEGFFLNYSGDYRLLKGIIKASYINDLDLLPFPDWSLFPMKKFIHYPLFGNKSVYPMLGSRGCPFLCRYYCAYPIVAGTKVRYRKVEKIIEELKFLIREYNAKAVLFRDANFSLDMNRTEKLCKKIIKNNIHIRWACETHLSCLDKSLVDLMYASGARAITVGIESRNKEILKASHRQDTNEEHLQEIVNYCENKGIKIVAGYIFGNLKDTSQSILDTIRYAKQLNTSFAQFVISTPYPGTQYFQDLETQLTTRNWELFDTYTLVFKHPNFSRNELERLKEKTCIEYYFRPRWILARLLRNKLNDIFDRG